MDVHDAVMARRSIRAFTPQPIPAIKLKEIMELALWAPSWGNTQPWKLTLVGGEPLKRIKEEYIRMLDRDAPPNHDFDPPKEYSDIQKARYQGLGKGLFQALGIAREDKERRHAHYQEMARCFGAPHVIYLHLDRGYNPHVLMDSGIILQTIALLAVEQGFGTCYLAMAVRYPQVVRKHAGIPDDQMLVMGMAIGRPILNHPANVFRSKRGESEEFLRFVDLA